MMSETKKEETTKQEERGRVAVRKEQKKETVIYIGPTIKNVVATGTLYSNGLPNSLKKEMEKRPMVRSLIVPVGTLAECQRELAVPGSALRSIYERTAAGQEG